MKKAFQIGLGIGSLLLISQSIFVVPEGHRVLVFNKAKGLKDQVYEKGWGTVIPFLQNPIYIDVRPKERQIQIKSNTKDSEIVHIKISVCFQPQVKNLKQLFLYFGLNYDKMVIDSCVNESVKDLISKKIYSKQILTNREDFDALVKDTIFQSKLKDFFVQVLDVKVLDADIAP